MNTVATKIYVTATGLAITLSASATVNAWLTR